MAVWRIQARRILHRCGLPCSLDCLPLPGLHSALFAPEYAPAITTGVTAMTAVALELLKK